MRIPDEGLKELLDYTLTPLDPMVREAMVRNIYLTGGNCKLPGFKERLEVEIRKLLPCGSLFHVNISEDPVGDTWRGMALYSRHQVFKRNSISLEEFQENGLDRSNEMFNQTWKKIEWK
eukprot:TRINITY_DN2575_c0_g1_i1.p1 TRINITY_DN2575_c0_g1~~TRINITY_DN2575_c0_g1_i1.p1  ORF type:complete len:119 (+),score=19.69 TRINITY_DN2575_c0_g1_i1:327-683(+)